MFTREKTPVPIITVSDADTDYETNKSYDTGDDSARSQETGWSTESKDLRVELKVTSGSCNEIPGRLNPGKFSSLGSLMGLKRKGHNYIGNLIKKHKVTVFRVHIIGPRIVICDHIAMRAIFRSDCVRKVARFGSLLVNEKIMRFHTPVEFCNGEEWTRRRNFFIKHLHMLKENWSARNMSKIVEEELVWMSEYIRMRKPKDFEDVLGHCMCNIVTRVILGCKLDYTQVKKWFRKLLIPVMKQKKLDDPDAIRACEILGRMIEESPTGVSLCSQEGLSVDEICMDLLYMSM